MFRTTLRSSRTLLRPNALTSVSSSRLFAYRFLSQESRSKIQAAIHSSPVVLFMKGTAEIPQCGFSRATMQVLGMEGVPPEKIKTYNVLDDPDLRNDIKEFSDWPTIPQLYIGGEFVGGCDILMAMYASGELEALLLKTGVVEPLEPEPESPPQSS